MLNKKIKVISKVIVCLLLITFSICACEKEEKIVDDLKDSLLIGKEGKEVVNDTGKGSISSPYSLEDKITIIGYNATGFNYATSTRMVEAPITMELSNFCLDEKNYFWYDVCIKEAETDESITVSDYIYCRAITTSGQDVGAFIPNDKDGCVPFLLKGYTLRCYSYLEKYECDKVVIHYYREDGEIEKKYIKLN